MTSDMHDFEREDRIASYVGGEMTPQEAAAFERLMETDDRLRAEVEEWRLAFEAAREWANSEPPGIERVETLKIPAVKSGRSPLRRPVFPWWRWAAVAAVFVVGFLLGQVTRSPGTEGEVTPRPPANEGVATREAPHKQEKVVEPAKEIEETRGPMLADASIGRSGPRKGPSIERTYREDGKILIETNSEAGTRGLWVVDGNFRLNPATEKTRTSNQL